MGGADATEKESWCKLLLKRRGLGAEKSARFGKRAPIKTQGSPSGFACSPRED